MNDYLLTYYGDDFTGSTDVMEALVVGGVPTVLFLEPPLPDFVKTRFPHARAVGVAGISRTMSPTQMDEQLKPKFTALQALGAPLFHYKVCSTFDSSPTIGSIGHAIEIGRAIFHAPVVPLIVGAPALRRYVVFGNLFAGVGGQTYRLDRHPTMSKHPITPMNESDLHLHLGLQTARKIGLIDLLTFAKGRDALQQAYAALAEQGVEIVLFDTMDNAHLEAIGDLIWSQRAAEQMLIVGSSGVEYALTFYWRHAGLVHETIALPQPGSVDQLLVMAGSAAPTTRSQIEWALARGYVGLRLDTAQLIDSAVIDSYREHVIQTALSILAEGKSLILYTALGPDDPAIQQTRDRAKTLVSAAQSIGSVLGYEQGNILRILLEKSGLRRVCVAGGDTSGHVAHQLGIYALEMVVPIAPGAPLCRASSHRTEFDGLQISFKGGQNGGPDYFGAIQQGHAF